MSKLYLKSTVNKQGNHSLSTSVLRFLFPIALVLASYSLGTHTEARTMRLQTIELGTSGYNTKTAQWSLYGPERICQVYYTSMFSEDETRGTASSNPPAGIPIKGR